MEVLADLGQDMEFQYEDAWVLLKKNRNKNMNVHPAQRLMLKEYQLEFTIAIAVIINLLVVLTIQLRRTKWLITNVLHVALD